MNVSEVRIGALDAAETPIEAVYTKNEPHYAIYRTGQRVMVHFADEAAEKRKQQEILATLNPLRNEINALIDGWRNSREADKEALTKLYDRRIADALALALENDPTSAKALFKSTLDEIAEERQSSGRIEHLRYAALTAGAIALVVMLASWLWDAKQPRYLDHDGNALLFAAAIGAFGALVSIGIAIRERSLSTDLQTRDNVADAVLRVTVGAVGALLLVAMLRADLIDVDIGDVDLAHRAQAEARAADETKAEAEAARAGSCPPQQGTCPGGATPSPAPSTPPAVAPGPNQPAPNGAGTVAASGTSSGTPAAPAGSAAVVPGPSVTANEVAAAPVAAVETPATAPNGESRDERARAGSRTTELLVILVIAFFAGFSERMVKQLAEKMRFRDVAADLPPAGRPENPNATGGKAGPAGGGSPLKTPGSLGSPGSPEPSGDDDEVDGCIADVELAEDDLTDDSELPETTGGVAEQPRT